MMLKDPISVKPSNPKSSKCSVCNYSKYLAFCCSCYRCLSNTQKVHITIVAGVGQREKKMKSYIIPNHGDFKPLVDEDI